jgi:hypothetical protein
MEKSRPGHIYGICPDCNGEGKHPPKGIPENAASSERDVKNMFPTICDGCSGSGKRFVEIKTT